MQVYEDGYSLLTTCKDLDLYWEDGSWFGVEGWKRIIMWMTIWINGICRKLQAGKSKVGGNFQDPEGCEFVHV